MPTSLRERESWERGRGGGQRKWECPRNDLNAPLGVHIPSRQIMRHWAQNSDNFFHWVATSSFLSLHFYLSIFRCMCERETIWRRSVAQHRGGRGPGWEGKRRWRGGGWAGVQSLKISQTVEHKVGPLQSSSIPSISAIFVAFSIMPEVCLISWWQRQFSSWDIKRHAGSVTAIFPHVCQQGCFLSKANSTCYQNYSWASGSGRLAKGNLGIKLLCVKTTTLLKCPWARRWTIPPY